MIKLENMSAKGQSSISSYQEKDVRARRFWGNFKSIELSGDVGEMMDEKQTRKIVEQRPRHEHLNEIS